jgi:hypothetical protein
MVATIVVLAVVSTAASSIILNAVDGYADASTQEQLHVETSIALDRIVREIRMIPLDTAASGVAPDISSMTSSRITWEGNNTIALTGTDLELVENGGAAAVLLSDVIGFSLAARDESDALLSLPLTGAACDPVRRVAISITRQRFGTTETVRTIVFLRATVSGAGA